MVSDSWDFLFSGLSPAISTILYHLYYPHVAAHHAVPDYHLDKLGCLHKEINAYDAKSGEVRQQICRRHDHDPGKHGVKQERYQCFSTGTEREVGCVAERTKWHDDRRNRDKICRKLLDLRGGIVDLWEKPPCRKHDRCHDHTAEYAEYCPTTMLIQAPS